LIDKNKKGVGHLSFGNLHLEKISPVNMMNLIEMVFWKPAPQGYYDRSTLDTNKFDPAVEPRQRGQSIESKTRVVVPLLKPLVQLTTFLFVVLIQKGRKTY
jgi:hypothetical protein